MENIKLLKKHMKQNKLSLEAMARRLNVSYQTVYRWVNGKCLPSQLANDKIGSYFTSIK